MDRDIRHILEEVQNGGMSVDSAYLKLKEEPFEDIGYAKVDLHRKIRQGAGEIIYGAGKTAEQICGICDAMIRHSQSRILITRMDREKSDVLKAHLADQALPYTYHEDARIGIIGSMPEPDGIGRVVVATGGTSDLPVSEEAVLTAAFYGNEVLRLTDVGVSGLHRLLPHLDEIMSASVIIAVAGMEGALASVIGGLADCPVIAVPTSVGYGASFHGLSALLSMLNSCASGVSVVNIDNGFGAGFLASRINHPKLRDSKERPTQES